jgi:hypothetical protein
MVYVGGGCQRALPPMDVIEKLKLHMSFIVGSVFERVENDEIKFLEAMYKMVEYDISINCDPNHFYLMEYKKMNDNCIFFEINDPHIPLDLLVLTRDLIQHGRMKENIKNKKFFIHFRHFEDEVHLEDKENTLRVEAFMQMHKLVHNPIRIRIFLIKKLLSIKNFIRNVAGDPSTSQKEMIQYKVHRYRVETILKAIEMNTVLEY